MIDVWRSKNKACNHCHPFLWLSGSGSALSKCWLSAPNNTNWPVWSLPAAPSSGGHLDSSAESTSTCSRDRLVKIPFAWRKWKTSVFKFSGNDATKTKLKKLLICLLEMKEKATVKFLFSGDWQRGPPKVHLLGRTIRTTGCLVFASPPRCPSVPFKIWTMPITSYLSQCSFSFHQRGLEV